MPSVVIAAHNEAAVIGRCLQALADQRDVTDLQVVVAPNGCTDATAAVARGFDVEVVETEQPGKANALNLADEVATAFPRIYLDADIPLPPHAVAALVGALAADPAACAAVPARTLDVSGRPLIVRAYTAVSSRLPVFRDGLFGRGVIAVTESGRARFERFPELIADDLFLDSQFSTREKLHVDAVTVTIETPRRTRDLLNRLVRVRRGNAQLRAAAREGSVDSPVRGANRSAWFTEVVAREPRLLPAGIVYVAVTVLAAVLAKRQSRRSMAWGRDESTRSVASNRPGE